MIRQNRMKTVLTFAIAVMAIAGVSAQGAVQTMTTTANTSGSDNWNQGGNWSTAVPSGLDSAVISDGLAASASLAAATYSGGLTMGDGSSLTIQDQGLNTVTAALAIGTGTITMNNSMLDIKTRGTVNFPAFDLAGDGTITASANSGDNRGRNLTGVITGSGALTINGRNKQVWDWQQTNSFSGGLTLNAIDRHEMKFNTVGSAGAGDVTVNPRSSDGRSAVIIVNVDDVFADTATLTLNGNGWDGSGGGAHSGQSYKIIMNANDTVGGLIVDDVTMSVGIYDNTEAWLTGSGTLTVVPANPNIPDVNAGVDMITWSGQAVALDPNVVNNSDPITALTYAWRADTPDAGVTVEFDPIDPIAANDPAPTVTITKPADGVAVSVTLRLAVNNVGSENDDVVDTMTINVYDDACLAAKAVGPVELDATDIDENCITDFKDFAELALAWLYDYALTEAVSK